MHEHCFITNSRNYVWECEFIKQYLSQNHTISDWLRFEGAPIDHLVQHMKLQSGSAGAGGSGPCPVKF